MELDLLVFLKSSNLLPFRNQMTLGLQSPGPELERRDPWHAWSSGTGWIIILLYIHMYNVSQVLCVH